MAWTETTRARYERHSGRYASDLTDQEWGLIAPFLPPPKTTGRPRSTALHRSPETRSCAFFFIAPFGAVSIRAGCGATEWKSGTAGGHKRQKPPKKFKKSAQRLLVLSVLLSSGSANPLFIRLKKGKRELLGRKRELLGRYKLWTTVV